MKHLMLSSILAVGLVTSGAAFAQTPPTGAPPATSNPVDDPVVAPHDQGAKTPGQSAQAPAAKGGAVGAPAGAAGTEKKVDRFGGDNDPQMKAPGVGDNTTGAPITTPGANAPADPKKTDRFGGDNDPQMKPAGAK